MFEKIMYPSLNAKLKGMYAKTLSKEDFEDLMKQNKIKDAIILLKEKLVTLEDLNVDARRIEIEARLDDIILYDIKKIYKILDDETKKIFDAYILKFKLKTLRIIWKDLQVNNDFSNLESQSLWINFFPDIKGISKVTKKEEFLDNIKDLKIRNIFLNSKDWFELENNLSKFYLENLYKKVKRRK